MKFKLLSSILLASCLLTIYLSTTSSSGGISGASSGCFCHTQSANTIVLVSSPSSSYTNSQQITFTVTVTNATKLAAGFNLTTNIGTIISGGSGTTILSPTEITHSSPKALVSGTATWTFVWEAPANGNTDLEIQLAGNAVNLALGSDGDAWNNGNNPTIPFASTLDQSTTSPLRFLPVQGGVEIKWNAVKEKRVASYTLEGSNNAKDFAPLQSQIHQSNQEVYTFTDLTPAQNVRYYRLLIIDEDGKTYSTLAQKFNFNTEEGLIRIYPTLVDDGQLHVSGIENIQNLKVAVVDLFGRIHKSEYSTNGILQLNALPAGTYIVQIRQQGNVLLNQKIQVK